VAARPRNKSPRKLRADLAPNYRAIVPRLLRRPEAALYLGISAPQFDLLRARGEIRCVPVPSDRAPGGTARMALFDRVDLDAAIERVETRCRLDEGNSMF
jgi:hypothetical protein